MDKVVHFEVPFDNKERAMRFYKDLFGWSFQDMPEMSYVMAYSAATDDKHMVTEKGAINGGMFPREAAAPNPIIVISVASIDEKIKMIEASGGKLVSPKVPIPGGHYARVADSEGNVIGLA